MSTSNSVLNLRPAYANDSSPLENLASLLAVFWGGALPRIFNSTTQLNGFHHYSSDLCTRDMIPKAF